MFGLLFRVCVFWLELCPRWIHILVAKYRQWITPRVVAFFGSRYRCRWWCYWVARAVVSPPPATRCAHISEPHCLRQPVFTELPIYFHPGEGGISVFVFVFGNQIPPPFVSRHSRRHVADYLPSQLPIFIFYFQLNSFHLIFHI